jgi:hypothetical protein
MRGRIIRRASAAAFIVTLVLACAFGCSLFTKLDVDGYTPVDSGAPKATTFCLGDACLPVTYDCLSSADCQDGSRCCITVEPTSFRLACCVGSD